jgi:hypothetical protein
VGANVAAEGARNRSGASSTLCLPPPIQPASSTTAQDPDFLTPGEQLHLGSTGRPNDNTATAPIPWQSVFGSPPPAGWPVRGSHGHVPPPSPFGRPWLTLAGAGCVFLLRAATESAQGCSRAKNDAHAMQRKGRPPAFRVRLRVCHPTTTASSFRLLRPPPFIGTIPNRVGEWCFGTIRPPGLDRTTSGGLGKPEAESATIPTLRFSAWACRARLDLRAVSRLAGPNICVGPPKKGWTAAHFILRTGVVAGRYRGGTLYGPSDRKHERAHEHRWQTRPVPATSARGSNTCKVAGHHVGLRMWRRISHAEGPARQGRR